MWGGEGAVAGAAAGGGWEAGAGGGMGGEAGGEWEGGTVGSWDAEPTKELLGEGALGKGPTKEVWDVARRGLFGQVVAPVCARDAWNTSWVIHELSWQPAVWLARHKMLLNQDSAATFHYKKYPNLFDVQRRLVQTRIE